MIQLALPLAYKAADGEHDFFVSDANRDAVRHLDGWPTWPNPVTLLVGPEGSGKSHLGRIFARLTDGVLGLSDAPTRILDDVDRVRDEEALFHAWNDAQTTRRGLLLIARVPPRDWGVKLPDLASRLAATPQIVIQSPDDALLGAVMAKQFRDRGIVIGPDVLAYVLARIERSFVSVATAVELLDVASLAAGRAVTVPLAREALSERLDRLDADVIDRSLMEG